MKRMKTTLRIRRTIPALAAAAVVLHTACLGAQAVDETTRGATTVDETTVFENAAVLSMEAGSFLPGHAVMVTGSEIRWVGPMAEARVPDGARRIDASGRYLVPGLADMHAHFEASDLPLFLANGVTTVRKMNGTPGHVALRDSIARGLRAGPRMFVASPLLAGEAQRWRHELIESASDAYATAHRAEEVGYDFLKVYDGLSAEAYAALAEASGTLGIPLTGHIPSDVGLDAVLQAGQKSIEHAEQIMYATVDHRPDPAAIPGITAGIAGRIAATDTWVTPTLASQWMLSLRGTAAYAERLDRPEMRFVDAGLMGWWRSLAPEEGAADPPPGDARRERAEAFYGFLRDLTRALHEAGVPLLVGTDTPNPLLVPGYSLPLELSALVEAGIPSFEVLRAATEGAARFMGAEGEWGVIRPGAAADLVLLEADPLVDIGVFEAPVGVMAAGRWMDRDALERLVAGR